MTKKEARSILLKAASEIENPQRVILQDAAKSIKVSEGQAYVKTVKDGRHLDIYSSGDFEERIACVGSSLNWFLHQVNDNCTEDEVKLTCVNFLKNVDDEFVCVIHHILNQSCKNTIENPKREILMDFANSL
jgi:hypothetical protein